MRLRLQIWIGWRRLWLERAVARIQHRGLVKAWRAAGSLCYALQQALVALEARHEEALGECVEQERRDPLALCGACGQVLEAQQ